RRRGQGDRRDPGDELRYDGGPARGTAPPVRRAGGAAGRDAVRTRPGGYRRTLTSPRRFRPGPPGRDRAGSRTSVRHGGGDMRRIVVHMQTTFNNRIADVGGGFWEPFAWGEEEMAYLNQFVLAADTWALSRKLYEAIVPWWEAVAKGEVPDDAPA